MFKSILRNNTILGSIQLVNIFIQLIKGKLVAVILGSNGYGLIAMYNGFLDLGVSATMLGSNTSIVSTISKVQNESLKSQIRFSQFLFVGATSTIFVIITNIFSYEISQIVFATSDYEHLIQLSGIIVLFRQLTLNFQSILQAQRDIKGLSISSLLGLILASSGSVFIYLLFGIEALFYAILLTHIFTSTVYAIYSRKHTLELPTIVRLLKISYSTVKPGLYLFLGAIIQLIVLIYIRNSIARNIDVSEVGILNAGLLIMNSYVGLVLTGLSSDYLPRLSSLIRDDENFFVVLSEQFEIILRIIVPILIAIMVFSSILIPILFSSEFVGLEGFISIFVFASLFKSLSWVLSYVFIATSKMKIFLIAEIIFNAFLSLIYFSNISSISIENVAYSFVVAYVVYFSFISLSLKRLYPSLKLKKLLIKLIIPLFCMLIVNFFHESWIIGIITFIFVSVFSGFGLFFKYKNS